MNSPLPKDEDKRLEFMFRELAEPLADDGFTDHVMQRVARRAWWRPAVLGAAAVIGGAVAIGPVANITVGLGRLLSMYSSRWHDIAWLMQSPLLVAVGLIVLLGPAALNWLEE